MTLSIKRGITKRRLVVGAVLCTAAAVGAVGGTMLFHDSVAKAVPARASAAEAGPAGAGIVGQAVIVLRTSDGHSLSLASRKDGTTCLLYDLSAASVCTPKGADISATNHLVVSGMVHVDGASGATTMFNLFGFAPRGATAVQLVHQDGQTTLAEFHNGAFYVPGRALGDGTAARAVDAAGRVISSQTLKP